MNCWMLDTNTVSLLLHRRSPVVDRRATAIGTNNMCVSAIGYAETRYGIAKNREAIHLPNAAGIFFAEVTIMPWTKETAERYGDLRATMRRAGRSLSPLDMLIAAHALDVGATLVSSDRAFLHVPGLAVEDWTA